MWKIILFPILFLGLSITWCSYNCPTNCDCKTQWSKCVIVRCADTVDVHADHIIIDGSLCPKHYTLLTGLPKMIKELQGSYCNQLKNCE